MDLKDIKAIIDLMKKNSISEFELEREGVKLKLKRGGNGAYALAPVDDGSAMSAPMPVAMPQVSSPATIAAPMSGGGAGETDIRSPMIGTFYRSPSPESGAYVEVGAEVNPDTVVCIIEAMKVMNEIKAEVRGVITQILVENSKPVEFGQPLFKIRPL